MCEKNGFGNDPIYLHAYGGCNQKQPEIKLRCCGRGASAETLSDVEWPVGRPVWTKSLRLGAFGSSFILQSGGAAERITIPVLPLLLHAG